MESRDGGGGTTALYSLLGDQFAFQGLNHLCNFVTLSTMKNFRLVCHSWNFIIRNHSRYSNRAIFHSKWPSQASDSFPIQDMMYWRELALMSLPIRRNKVFHSYWFYASRVLQSLIVDNIQVTCKEMTALLSGCGVLESIKFVAVLFSHEEFHLPNPAARQEIILHHNGAKTTFVFDEVTHKVFCPHQEYKGEAGSQTLKSISIVKMPSFPLCILDFLEQRSHGKLQSFSFEYNTESLPIESFHPTMEHMENYLVKILNKNRLTLKTFSWIKNQSNGGIIAHLTNTPELQLESLTISMQKSTVLYDVESPADIAAINVDFLPFIQAQTRLVELTIAVPWNNQLMTARMNEILPTLTNLRKLKLQIDLIEIETDRNEWFDWEDEPVRANIDIFRNLAKLTDLIIIDTTWRKDGRGLSQQHLTGFPASLRKLTLVHLLQETNIWNNRDRDLRNVFENPNLNLLTKLVLFEGRYMRSIELQAIIINMPLLEELTIRDSGLNDSCFTGFSHQICGHLRICHKAGLIMKDISNVRQEFLPISRLVFLRALDLSGCKNITDVTICYAIRFPELQKLALDKCHNVTDLGLKCLGTHNPNLQILDVRKLHRITHAGLVGVVEKCKGLQRINCSTLVKAQVGASEDPFLKGILHESVYKTTRSEMKYTVAGFQI